MTYLSWAVLYEGETDAAYHDQLIPRVMEDIILSRGTRQSTIPTTPAVRLRRDTVMKVAREACAAREAFHLIFIHADSGGRDLAAGVETRSTAYCQAMNTLCAWPPVRCITLSPRHETEAWILADPHAVMAALGYQGSPASLGLPANAAQAERLVDPKSVLTAAVSQVRGKRRRFDVKQIFPAIAQRQSLAALRQARSFTAFEASLLLGLADLGCV